MFHGLSRPAFPPSMALVSHKPCTLEDRELLDKVTAHSPPLSIGQTIVNPRCCFYHVSHGSDGNGTKYLRATSSTPDPCPKTMSLTHSRNGGVPLVQM